MPSRAVRAQQRRVRPRRGPARRHVRRPRKLGDEVTGNGLAKARIGKPMPRQKAAQLLDELLDRAATVNADHDSLFSVERIELFGSFADPDRQEVGDVDQESSSTDALTATSSCVARPPRQPRLRRRGVASTTLLTGSASSSSSSSATCAVDYGGSTSNSMLSGTRRRGGRCASGLHPSARDWPRRAGTFGLTTGDLRNRAPNAPAGSLRCHERITGAGDWPASAGPGRCR